MKNISKIDETTQNSYAVAFPPEATTIVYCQIGVQVPNDKSSQNIIEHMRNILSGNKIQPSHTDIAFHNEDDFTKNIIFICYFLHKQDYNDWRYSPSTNSLLNDEQYFCDQAGLWFESFYIDVNEFEGQYDRNNQKDGVSHFIDLEITNKYDYFGSMRDRMKASAWDNFSPSREQVNMTKQGDKISVYMPKNSCFVRTVQDLSEVTKHEKELYEDMVRPFLNKSIQELINTNEFGCLSIQCAREIDTFSRDKEIDSVLAYFQSLSHLEEWAKSDKTHLAMYGKYYHLLRKQNNKSAISLWHEVFILDGEQSEIFYIRCKETTGLLQTLYQANPMS